MVAGCLAAFEPDPTGSSAPASNGTGAGGGGGGSGDTPGTTGMPPAGADLGAAADAATPVAIADMAGSSAAADLATSCIKLVTPSTSGHHNAGAACLTCHDGARATLFTFAGTLYNAASNGATIAGATVEVIDAKGVTAKTVTSSNGNFYSSQPVTPPLTARATGCPNDVAMVAKATGDCNSSGCHTSAMRVHLP
ncbi:MAG: hypothetical protein JWM53_2488 [bacterium]|nr:hypothetical protein [bacterium]